MKSLVRGTLMMLTWIAVGIGAAWVATRWSSSVAIVLCAAAVLLPFLYVLVCTLYPSWGDTKCPKCGEPALQRPDRKNTLGVVCGACGFEDPEMYRAYLDEMR